jgi:pyridoxine 5-phosphate synthase
VAPVAALEGIAELNIGHAIVAQAVFDGWQNTIRNMKAAMITARLNAQRGVLLHPRKH